MFFLCGVFSVYRLSLILVPFVETTVCILEGMHDSLSHFNIAVMRCRLAKLRFLVSILFPIGIFAMAAIQ